MFARAPEIIEAADFDRSLPELPNTDAVFLVWAGERSSYLAKTSMLRRRLERILKMGETRRSLNLRDVATRVEYWRTGSRFESTLAHYSLAKLHFPENYLRLVKLRMPAYVRLILANEFPRAQVTTRIADGRSIYYGPFPTRASAEEFEARMLDLFQMRRCQENLAPSPEHPGCIYGEMNMCMRPCQAVVSVAEYRSEANRVGEFLSLRGAATLAGAAAARERLSEEMNFEEAARQHQRYERIRSVLSLGGELASDVDRLHGVAVAPSITPDAVTLWFLCRGAWRPALDFPLVSHVSMDRRLQELTASLNPIPAPAETRQEHLALLARWFYSSWRDGAWIGFDDLEHVPYRKLVRAISRVHQAAVRAPLE
jgi:excinuclease ABC subunit C